MILKAQIFEFRGLSAPTFNYVMDAIDIDQLRANWKNQIAHQINDLPNVESYVSDLSNAIAWWLD